MAYDIIKGTLEKKRGKLFKSRVSIVAAVTGTKALQFISTNLLLGVQHAVPGHPPVYAGPTLAGWENLRHTHPEATENLTYIGALAAVPNGDWAGHIDWVQPIDGMKIGDMKAQAMAEGRPEPGKPEPMQTVRLPAVIDKNTDFVHRLQKDPHMNAELIKSEGGTDLLAIVLNAAVRLAKGEA